MHVKSFSVSFPLCCMLQSAASESAGSSLGGVSSAQQEQEAKVARWVI